MDDGASSESGDAGEDNVFLETDDITSAVVVLFSFKFRRNTCFSHGRATTLLGYKLGDA